MAARGFEVLGVDIDAEKVRRVNEGLPPVEEPLLAETMVTGKSRFRATTDHREAVGTDVSFFIRRRPVCRTAVFRRNICCEQCNRLRRQ